MATKTDRGRPRFLYIHGFNSSPASAKAQVFAAWVHRNVAGSQVMIPELSHDPVIAMEDLEELVCQRGGIDLLLGSSLGGYYATWLSEKYAVPAALVNPAVSPHRYLSTEFLGWHRNYYTGKEYELTLRHVHALAKYECPSLSRPEDLFLLVQTGDDVLDYRVAVDYYRDCRQLVQQGGSHSFERFEEVLAPIMDFAGIPIQS